MSMTRRNAYAPLSQCGRRGLHGTHDLDDTRTRGLMPVGFTLIEMLVVITILAILMSLIIGAVFAAQRRAKARRTQASLILLEQAAGNYKTDHADFPNDGGKTADPAQSAINLYDALVNGQGRLAPYIEPGDVPTGEHDGTRVFVDAWKNPILFEHPRRYLRTPPKARSIRLFSAGPDGDMYTPKDNIVNWDTEEYPDTPRVP